MDHSPPGFSVMGFSKQQQYCVGCPPSPEDLTNPGIEPVLLHWQAGSLLVSNQGTPTYAD